MLTNERKRLFKIQSIYEVTKGMKSEEEEKRREEACKRAGCNEDMFCYGGKACYDLCDKAMGLMKRN